MTQWQGRVTGALLPEYSQQFFTNYGLLPYTDNTGPTLFIGCYPARERTGQRCGLQHWRDLGAVLNHRGPAWQMWCGEDAASLIGDDVTDGYQLGPMLGKVFRDRPDIWHISTSLATAKALDMAGLRHKFLPIHWVDVERFKPCPLGDAVFVYDYADARKHQDYGGHMVERLRERFPHIDFISLKAKDVSREDMPGVYAKCFLGLRPKEHDGMAATLLELGLMGRRTIHNGWQPCAIRWDGLEDIATIIHREWLYREATKDAQLNAMAEATLWHMTMPEGWQDEEFWK